MLPKISPSIWALIARYTGTCCPAFVLWMPTWWAVDAHATGIVGPTSGHIFHADCSNRILRNTQLFAYFVNI